MPPTNSSPSYDEALEAVRTLIKWAGDNPERNELHDTPKRVLESYKEFFAGYKHDPLKLLQKTFEQTENYGGMVLLQDINLESYCEHHMLPIIGKAHIAYIPNKRIIGISKIARAVDLYAKRLQIQERLTVQIAEVLQKVLEPKGVAVLIEANHMCMTTRGVHKPGTIMKTSHVLGIFREDPKTRAEFFALVEHKL